MASMGQNPILFKYLQILLCELGSLNLKTTPQVNVRLLMSHQSNTVVSTDISKVVKMPLDEMGGIQGK